jgi:SAM-dependent methyltransferase
VTKAAAAISDIVLVGVQPRKLSGESYNTAMKHGAAASPDAASVAADVRAFYEDHPYPPPVDSLERYRELWRDGQRRRADHHLYWPYLPFRANHSILIAGCGASQAAKHALRWPDAKVTGIDFSAKSIAATEALKHKHNLDNLQVHQLPVERAGELETSFDQIVCTGVLHHLPDPGAGLSALRGVLDPHGAMLLMVYAPYGRAGIYMLQEFCRRIGIRAAENEIRDLIHALTMLPRGHPLENLLREAPDFRNEAALADALLNPQDRAYSVPQLFEFIEGAALRFGRWVRQAPYVPQCGAVAGIPQMSRIARLPPAEQYAALELFRGTMVRHSAVVYRAENYLQQIDFDGDAWHDYVPIRLPDTICVQERLPLGAAAVLINQSHTYTDIYLPIDTQEKRLLDAIDGQRTIRKIAQEHGTLEGSRIFFERLWRYDQVVFDAS